jgi:hypothetical protein
MEAYDTAIIEILPTERTSNEHKEFEGAEAVECVKLYVPMTRVPMTRPSP